MTDLISRQAAIGILEVGKEILDRVLSDTDVVGHEREKYLWGLGLIEAYINDMKELPSAQPDAVTASLEELINDYGEDGYFIIDGVNYQANELLNELKINSSVGEKFRKQITKTIVQYFMKFGG